MDRSVVGEETFDFNSDGLAHVGMLPDLIADFEAQGLSQVDLDPLLNSADGYVRLWEKTWRRSGRSPTSIASNALLLLEEKAPVPIASNTLLLLEDEAPVPIASIELLLLDD